MVYVEWLRVRNALRILGYVLLALIIGCGILRIALNGNYLNMAARQQATVVRQHSGTVTLINPNTKTSRVIHRSSVHAYSNVRIVTKPYPTALAKNQKGPSVQTRAVKVKKHLDTGLLQFLSLAAFVAVIFAMVLGASLAKENDHLEIAWTKPINRLRLALYTFGVDIIAILASLVLSFIALVIMQSMWEAPHLGLAPSHWLSAVLLLLVPISWYALCTCVSSSLRGRGYSIPFIAVWVAGIIIPSFATIPNGTAALGNVVLMVFRVLRFFDPLQFTTVTMTMVNVSVIGLSFSRDVINVLTLVGITILYLVGSLIQWQRLEA